MENKELDAVEIRNLRQADEAHVCARFMADSEPWVTLDQTYDDLLKLLNASSKETYVAVTAAEVVGFIILDMKGSFTGYIKTIGVLTQWQKRGIGSQLLAFAEVRIFSQSPNIFICVSSFNPGAQKFYQHRGYQVVGTLKDYLVTGHDEILLRKTIAPLAEFQKDSSITAPHMVGNFDSSLDI